MDSNTHPEHDTLHEYLLGKVDVQTAREIESHVEQCAVCLRQLDGIDAADAVVSLVRSGGGKPSSSRETIDCPPPEIEGYEILREIGRGGMGIVYQAVHHQLNRVVALKTLAPAFSGRVDLLKRLELEAQALAHLQHSNIVQVFEVGQANGLLFVALEYVEGEDLEQYLAHQSLSPRESAELVACLARAMHFAHQRGILHRDLKPGNVLIDDAGTAKIVDFGLAKQLGSDDKNTQAGTLLGTPGYMAPEQADGKQDVHVAADVYGLGAILYRCLTGRPPLDGGPISDFVRRLHDSTPPRPRSLAPRVPRDLQTICLKCLEKDAGARYAGAASLADDLQRFLDGQAIQARPVSVTEHVWRWSRRNPVAATLAATLLLGLVAGVTATTNLWIRAERARAATDLARGQLQGALDQTRESNARAKRNLYASRINGSWSHYLLGHRGTARSLLEQCKAELDPGETPGWEWYYLRQLCHNELFLFGQSGDLSVRDVAFSPDGRLLAAAYGPLHWKSQVHGISYVHLRDADDGRSLSTLAVDCGRINGLAFSSDGQLLAATANDGRLIVWDVRHLDQGAPVPEVYRRDDAAEGSPVTFHDRNLIGYLSTDNEVIIHDVSRREVVLRRAVDMDVLSFDFDMRRRLLVVATRRKDRIPTNIRLTVTGFDSSETRHEWNVDALAGHVLLRLDDGLIYFGTDDGRLSCHDAISGDETGEFRGHPSPIWAAARGPNGRWLATADRSGQIRVWDKTSREERRVFDAHEHSVTGLSFSADGSRLASGSVDGTVRVWDLTRPDRGQYRAGLGPGTAQLVVRPRTGEVIVAAKQRCAVVDLVTGAIDSDQPLRVTGKAMWPRNDYALSSDGRLVAAPSFENFSSISVCDAETGEIRHELPGHRGRVVCLAWDDGARRLVSAAFVGDTGTSELKLWDARSGRPSAVRLPDIQGVVFSLAMNKDATRLAAGQVENGPVRIFDTRDGRLLRQVEGVGSCVALAFDPVNTRLAAADQANRRVIVWDSETGQEQLNLAAPEGVAGVAFSADGSRIAAMGAGAVIHLWDARDGNALINLESFGPSLGTRGWSPRLAFSEDGRTIVSLHGNYVNVWSVPEPGENAAERRRAEYLLRLPVWHLSQADAAREAEDAEATGFHLRHCSWDIQAGSDHWCRVAAAHAFLGQFEEAERALDQAVAAAPRDPWAWFERGKFRCEQGQWAAALSDLRRAEQSFVITPRKVQQLIDHCRLKGLPP